MVKEELELNKLYTNRHNDTVVKLIDIINDEREVIVDLLEAPDSLRSVFVFFNKEHEAKDERKKEGLLGITMLCMLQCFHVKNQN